MEHFALDIRKPRASRPVACASASLVFVTFEEVKCEEEQQSVLNDFIDSNDDACSV